MDNRKYWEERQALNYISGEKEIVSFYKEIEKAFIQAKREIESVINDFYIRYADNNGVSYVKAQKLLEKQEIGKLKDYIKQVYATMGTRDVNVINKSIKARITRYEALEMQIQSILDNLYDIQYKDGGINKLKEVYENSYYNTLYNIDIYNGFHKEFAQVDVRTIEELIKYPFNGANYSDRLWKQKDHMITKLKENITTMIVQGKNPKTLSADFAKIFKTKEFEAYRLLHTEGSFIIEQGTRAAYKEDGVEEYQILATLDTKTSDICREQDSKTYKVDDYITGSTAPPFHQFCRTTTVPYYGEDEGERAARDEDGKTYKVPANMSYTQWYDRYITKETEKEYNNLIGLVANNIKITGISEHLIDRAIQRNVLGKDAKDALINPLKVGKIKKKDNGKSQEIIGENARVIINPDTGNIITVWKTSTKLRNKLKGVK
ncbi:minor capsid protein [Clostridium tertium]|uniref:minor capsid protein n=1 Tax=Clostridium tertium TaxID=1559 RepID=UPI002A83A23F|nr:minor capsid protein [Clostridium tertium]MDY4606393.1 minor capsid protein [Clostridium tertium]